ncbi:hypothetical protein SpCBS45565_g06248 [Spizellomyces sp. 'palustris']|nr:hypothetical protein SpCBS45565_g06248 [Spizellomyces sp. 'palustris']
MLLTLADAGSSSIRLNGPNNLTHFMAATRHFIYRQSLDLSTFEFQETKGEPFQDENITVHPVYLAPEPIVSPETLNAATNGPDVITFSRKRKNENPHDHLICKRAFLRRMFPVDQGCHPLSDHTGTPIADVTIPAGEGERATVVTMEDVKDSNDVVVPRTEIGRLGSARLPRTEPDHIVLSYICRGPNVPGKFNPVAAQKLGVKPGKDFGILAGGQTVTTADGIVVYPHMCMGEPRPGAIIVIIDCPSPAYINALVTSPEFVPFHDKTNGNHVRCIVHIIGDGVLQDPRYVEWMNKFGHQTRHFIISRRHNPMGISYLAAGRLQHKLNVLDPEVFPLPYFTNDPEEDLRTIKDLPKGAVMATPLTNYIIEPAPKLDNSESLRPFLREEVSGLAETADLISCIKKDIERRYDSSSVVPQEKDVTIVPLGTGAAIPGKYRNVSSTFLMLSSGNVLLDAGEGTLGQLFRHFGPDMMKEALQNLRMVFVSHLHADHHLGVVRILKYWDEVRDSRNPQPLIIVAPARYQIWLEEYADCEEFGFKHLLFLDSEDVRWNASGTHGGDEDVEKTTTINTLKKTLHLKDIHTVGVHHCPWAYALVLDTETVGKVVFSGDCRPSEDLVIAGRGASVVIHEATLEDDKVEEALEKRHCTTGEAIQVAKSMEAQNLLLTHFSQRYPKIPILPNDVDDDLTQVKVGIAYDLMRAKLSSFWRLPLLVPGLRALFPQDDNDGVIRP